MAKDLGQRYQAAQDLLKDLYKLTPAERKTSFSRPTERVRFRTAIRPDTGYKKKKSSLGMLSVFCAVLLLSLGYVYREKISSLLHQPGLKHFLPQVQKTDLLKETQSSLAKLETAEEHFTLGRRYFQQGLTDKAIAEYQEAVSLREDYAPYYKGLALAYEKKKEYKKAIKAWMDLLKYEPDGADAQLARQHMKDLHLE